MDKKEVITVFTLPIFVILLVINILIFNTPSIINLSFSSDQATESIFEGKLNLVISNEKESSEKILQMDTLYGNTDFNISSSNLFETNSNKFINSSQIKFNQHNPLLLKNISFANPKVVKVAINTNDPGLYHGNLFITNNANKTSVPITVDVKPNLYKVAIWIIDGIGLSVVTLNVIGYLFLDRRVEQAKQSALNFIGGLYLTQNEGIANRIRNTDVSRRLEGIVDKLGKSRIHLVEKELKRLEIEYGDITASENTDTIPDFINNLNLDTGNVQNDEFTANRLYTYDKLLNRILDSKFSLKDYTTTGIIEKNVVSGFTAVAFGLIVGFIPIMQTDYINNLREIGLTDELILIGLGIGVGNLNEAVSKIWEKTGDSDDK
jgi:hypothetical protein